VNSPDDETLYAEMRAAIRGDRERAEKRAAEKQPERQPPPSEPPTAAEPPRVGGIRRLFGSRRSS
jgi:hypothetical protein